MYTANVKRALAYFLGAFLLIGCSGGAKVATKGNDPSGNDGVTSTGLGHTGTAESASGGTSDDPGSRPSGETKVPPKPNIPEPNSVQKPGTGNWTPTKLTSATLAANMGKAMSTMTGVECRSVVAAKTPEGVGRSLISFKFATPNAFRVEYIEPGLIPKRSTILADGAKVRAYAKNRWTPYKPIASGFDPAQAKVDAQKFLTHFSRAMVANAVDKSDPWAPLFNELQSGKSGFDCRIEERHFVSNGRNYLSYRIVATRRAAQSKSLGPASMEIVVDGKYWLPVTIRTEMQPPGQKPWSYEWTGQWRFKQKFAPSDLALAQSKPSA